MSTEELTSCQKANLLASDELKDLKEIAQENRPEAPEEEEIELGGTKVRISIVQQILVEEIQAAAKRAVEFKQKRDKAKTETKRKFYDEKLVKNNEEAADAVAALNNLIKEKETMGSDVDESVLIPEGGTEETSDANESIT